MSGGEKFGFAARISARVSPFSKAARNEVLDTAASSNRFAVSPGARLLPDTRYWLKEGGLLDRNEPSIPATGSKNTPIPPRSTVLRETPNGCQAKINRGDHRSVSNPGNASRRFVRIALLYGTPGS